MSSPSHCVSEKKRRRWCLEQTLRDFWIQLSLSFANSCLIDNYIYVWNLSSFLLNSSFVAFNNCISSNFVFQKEEHLQFISINIRYLLFITWSYVHRLILHVYHHQTHTHTHTYQRFFLYQIIQLSKYNQDTGKVYTKKQNIKRIDKFDVKSDKFSNTRQKNIWTVRHLYWAINLIQYDKV